MGRERMTSLREVRYTPERAAREFKLQMAPEPPLWQVDMPQKLCLLLTI